jgi:hypothetical protein
LGLMSPVRLTHGSSGRKAASWNDKSRFRTPLLLWFPAVDKATEQCREEELSGLFEDTSE